MPTGWERIAEKARQEPALRFTSLAHHLTPEGLWRPCTICRHLRLPERMV